MPVSFQTGRFAAAAVTRAAVHWVISSVLSPSSTTFSIVLLKMPITSPLVEAL